MKRAFTVKLKAFFIIFKGPSVTKNCLGSETAKTIGNYWKLLVQR